ncbi:MAG TPA: phage tail protein [Anaeromyxobacteraceae bacterium]|jgi:hypothetical protein
MNSDRRGFLKTMGGLAAAAAAAPACAPRPLEAQAGGVAGAGDDTAVAGAAAKVEVGDKFGLELDGSFAGWLESFEGGDAVGAVVTEKVGPDLIRKKHLGPVKYEDITISTGAGMSKVFYDWIRDTLGGRPPRKNGSVIAADRDAVERSRLDFSNALVSEVSLPAADVSSKDSGALTVKLSPELTRRAAGSGASIKVDSKVAKRWLPANFRLTIDGLDTSHVSKVDSITIKQKVAESPIGDDRDCAAAPAGLEFPNLAVTVAQAQAQSFYDWHEDFVITGNSGDDRERAGALEFLDPTRREVLFSLSFNHLGVFKVAAEKAGSGDDGIRRVKAEMYCESMEVEFTGGF